LGEYLSLIKTKLTNPRIVHFPFNSIVNNNFYLGARK
jgi:hypothetical protein